MRSAILIFALAFKTDFGVDAAATTTRQEKYYADALEELEKEIGSGVHGATQDDAKTNVHKRRGAHHNTEELAGFKKKVDRRKAERARRATDDIEKLNDQLQHFEGQSSDDLRQNFHQRQKEKKIHLEKMHQEVSETLKAHHKGRKLLSNEDLERHTKKKAALERKNRTLEEETPERYIDRMERHEEKLLEKLERKKRRHDERSQRRNEEL